MTVIVQDVEIGEVRIPDGITNIQAFRRWATSNKFPERGRFSFLCGTLHVDLSMEELFTHALVKAEITIVQGQIIKTDQSGYYFPDGSLLSNPKVSLSTEPDAMFVSYEAIRTGRIRFTKGKQKGCMEVVGSPDMVVEIVSESSVTKDYEILRELYWKAKIPEYWLIDARERNVLFEILRHGQHGYVSTRRQPSGWLASPVFGRSFRLKHRTDRLGNPEFTLEVRK
ncbi:MAG TPA: Uma2 family endonuclease [Gemmataceae bacterium]|nr:Uma2 family endonuclease [Gemmataceae bacterium]